MKKVIAAILSIAAIVLPQSAIAQYTIPHKYTDVFGKTRIYIPGTADTVLDVITETTKQYIFTANYCGYISIRQSQTRLIKRFSTSENSINVTNFSAPNRLHTIGPACNYLGQSIGWNFWDGGPTSEENVNAPNGWLFKIIGTNQFFIKIRPALITGGGVQATVTYENIIKNKINSCGYGTITVSTTRPMSIFKIAGVDYTLANLPSTTKPMICRTQGNSRIRYVPLN